MKLMKTMNPIQMITNDVRFQTEKGQRFSLRAAAIFIENGSALFATNASRDYYYPIGGAVELGETTQQAALREVSEEIGITCQVNRLLFIQENFFKRDDGAFKDLTCHEITFYFLMKPQEIQKIETHSFTSNNTLTEY